MTYLLQQLAYYLRSFIINKYRIHTKIPNVANPPQKTQAELQALVQQVRKDQMTRQRQVTKARRQKEKEKKRKKKRQEAKRERENTETIEELDELLRNRDDMLDIMYKRVQQFVVRAKKEAKDAVSSMRMSHVFDFLVYYLLTEGGRPLSQGDSYSSVEYSRMIQLVQSPLFLKLFPDAKLALQYFTKFLPQLEAFPKSPKSFFEWFKISGVSKHFFRRVEKLRLSKIDKNELSSATLNQFVSAMKKVLDSPSAKMAKKVYPTVIELNDETIRGDPAMLVAFDIFKFYKLSNDTTDRRKLKEVLSSTFRQNDALKFLKMSVSRPSLSYIIENWGEFKTLITPYVLETLSVLLSLM